jgi:hypothetical protein
MKRISAAFWDDKIYLEPSGRTEDWLWVSIGEVNTFTLPLSDLEIGNAILKTLSQSKMNVPIPENINGPGPTATMAGFKTWPSFAKKAKLMTIVDDEKGVQFWPSGWGGAKNGHYLLEEEAFFAESSAPEILGSALRKAIDLCE